jgi:hypothetical protein
MKALVIYESMYGNTRSIATAVAEGLRDHGEAIAIPVAEADPDLVATADIVVVGGPTHAHGMSHAATRRSAEGAALTPDTTLKVEPAASGPGLREWFAKLGTLTATAAAFDTRFDGPSVLTGRASKGISRALHRHGATLISEPQSFLVDKHNHLEPGQEASARVWGDHIGAEAAAATTLASR